MKRKIYLWIGIVAVILAAAFFAYSKWMAPTRVAFVNYQAISLGNIYKANDNSHIKLVEVSTDELDKLKDFDMVFISGMGLRIVEEQREALQRLADKGVPIYTMMATNPDNNICNLDSVVRDILADWETMRGRFVKVVSPEYQRALADIAARRQAELPPGEAERSAEA